jgi:hypothetical protein
MAEPILAILAAVPPAEAEAREAIRTGAAVLLGLSLGGLILVVGLLVLFFLRRGRRMREDAHRRTAGRTRSDLDPWAEAGRRAGPIDDDPEPGGGGDGPDGGRDDDGGEPPLPVPRSPGPGIAMQVGPQTRARANGGSGRGHDAHRERAS